MHIFTFSSDQINNKILILFSVCTIVSIQDKKIKQPRKLHFWNITSRPKLYFDKTHSVKKCISFYTTNCYYKRNKIRTKHHIASTTNWNEKRIYELTTKRWNKYPQFICDLCVIYIMAGCDGWYALQNTIWSTK